MALPPIDPIAAVGLAMAGLVLVPLFVYGVLELRLANYVLRSPPASALDAGSGGLIELRGVARPVRGTLRSPFTDTPAIAYQYEVQEEQSSTSGSSWVTIDRGGEYLPFQLDDGSARVLIEPPGADFRLEEHERIDVDGGTTPPERIQRFIDDTDAVDCQHSTLDLRVVELRTGADRRFREFVLEPGEAVHVIGTARYETTVPRTAGSVNAAVGIDPRTLTGRPLSRVRHRLVGSPFVISDSTATRLGRRAALVGGGAVGTAAVGMAVVVAVIL